MTTSDAQVTESRTAAQAGWHVSRYNLTVPLPDSKRVAITNLYKGTCAEYSSLELYLMSVLDQIDENHPIIERLSERGLIVNFDEREALFTMGRAAAAAPMFVSLTICPTMGCNFDCPYCFENHFAGKMSPEVQDDVVALVDRMLEHSAAKTLSITWFGGEPLLAADVIESLTERLLEVADKYGVDYSAGIVTNGYLLTEENIRLLEKCKVNTAQVTLDGIGLAHDATRYLRGGGPTFDRIVENLHREIPFKIHIRHNVHSHNIDQIDELRSFVQKLAEETGNNLVYYPALVSGSEAADVRGKQVDLVKKDDNAAKVTIMQESGRFRAGRGHYCGAHSLWSVGIDEKGNLQKCWESVDKPEFSYGTAHDWDPMNPLATASNPDMLTCFLNTAPPSVDDECKECVWLPYCVGGCPYRRLFDGGKECLGFKDHADDFVLALHKRLQEQIARGESGELTADDARYDIPRR